MHKQITVYYILGRTITVLPQLTWDGFITYSWNEAEFAEINNKPVLIEQKILDYYSKL
jgi:hypothetical protein